MPPKRESYSTDDLQLKVLSSFSSRGWAQEGRFRPLSVCKGTSILFRRQDILPWGGGRGQHEEKSFVPLSLFSLSTLLPSQET